MPAKQQIAKKLGFNDGTKQVNKLINQYQMMKMQHGWLKREAYRKRTLPADNDEVCPPSPRHEHTNDGLYIMY